jgi:inward rectifier potassium channel
MSTHHSPWTSDTKPEPARHMPRGRKLTTTSGTVIAHGMPGRAWFDLYHRALNLNWPTFFGALAAMFLILNMVFAGIYMLGTDPIAHQSPPGFPGAFFFSVETLATVGYGDMHPQTYYAHLIATLEIFTGMSGIALATGLVFARFSRPRAKIIFARYVVVRTYDGRPTLMVRSANARQNVIAEANAKLRLVRRETTPEGDVLWRIRDLTLVRDQHPIFLLGWLLVHVIDDTSPLYGETAETLAQSDASFMVMIEGSDETTAQTMQARHEWSHQDIRWQHRFADLLHDDEDGVTHIDYTQFDKVMPCGPTERESELEPAHVSTRP